MAFGPRDSDWNTYVSRSFWNIQFQCRCFPTVAPVSSAPTTDAVSSLLRISSYAQSALPLFSLSMFCTVPSLIFWPDRSDISSAILLNGIHCTTLRYVTSARRLSPYLIRQLGASQLFTQPHSQTFS